MSLSDYYYNILWTTKKIRQAIERKQPELNKRENTFHNNITQPSYTSLITRQKLRPPFSPER